MEVSDLSATHAKRCNQYSSKTGIKTRISRQFTSALTKAKGKMGILQKLLDPNNTSFAYYATIFGALFSLVPLAWGASAAVGAFLKTFGKRFYIPQNPDDFYNYYAEQISSASTEIWMTSDGFNMRNPISRKYAELMGSAFDKAMSKRTTVYRFQILETMHINWIDELIKIKEKYPYNCHIYINKSLTNIPSVCVINPKHRNCVTERMDQMPSIVGQGSYPASYIFRHNDKDHAKKTLEIVQSLINSVDTIEVTKSFLLDLKEELLNYRVRQITSHQVILFDEEVINYVLRESGAEEQPRLPKP